MEAFIRIGDTTLTVVQGHFLQDPTAHVVSCHDTYKIEGGLEHKAVIVPDEATAIRVVADFLQLDGPTGLFREHFEQFCP